MKETEQAKKPGMIDTSVHGRNETYNLAHMCRLCPH